MAGHFIFWGRTLLLNIMNFLQQRMKQGKNGWDSGKKNYKRTKTLLKLKFVFALFKLVFFPAVLAVNNFSRLSCCFQNFQAIKKNLFLLVPIEYFTHGVTKRIFKEIGTWRIYRFANPAGDRDSHCRNALSFYFTLDQTDRLVTDASSRN